MTAPPPASAGYNSTFTVAATASSGLPVIVSTPAVGGCKNVGSTITMTSGTTPCTVNFDQAGDSNYAAALRVTQTTSATLIQRTAFAVR